MYYKYKSGNYPATLYLVFLFAKIYEVERQVSGFFMDPIPSGSAHDNSYSSGHDIYSSVYVY